jgi:dCMP deaminase
MHDQKWLLRFMDVARLVSDWSRDPSTKVGAVLVDSSKRIIGTGYNGFPRGVNDEQARYADRETKYRLVVHAEVNALLNAVAEVRGATLVCTRFPCTECAKVAIQLGISEVVYDEAPSEHWTKDAVWSAVMMAEAGVSHRRLVQLLGDGQEDA